MKCIVQFPSCDLRRFSDKATGVLDVPGWPSPEPDREFVRACGHIRYNETPGLQGWIAEPYVCSAKRALRFQSFHAVPLSRGEAPCSIGSHTQLRVTHRHFLSDGVALVKLEVGFQPAPNAKYKGLDINTLIDHISALDIFVVKHVGLRSETEKFERISLALAGPAISRFFLEATTSRCHLCNINTFKSLIKTCRPLIYVELEYDEALSYESGFQLVAQGPAERYILLHGRRDIFNGRAVPVWIMKSGPKFISRDRDNLRIFLLRLHAEHECLRGALRAIALGEIAPSPYSPESQILQSYLNEATRRVLRLGQKFRSQGPSAGDQKFYREEDIELLAQASFDHLNPGQRAALLERLKIIAIRKNIELKLESYLESDVKTASTLNLNIGKFVMTDQRQKVSHSSNVALVQAGQDAKLRIDRSFKNVEESSTQQQMLALLSELRGAVEGAIDMKHVPDPMALARDFEDFAREASSEAPRRSKLELAGEFIEKGLARAGAIAESSAKTIKAILDLVERI